MFYFFTKKQILLAFLLLFCIHGINIANSAPKKQLTEVDEAVQDYYRAMFKYAKGDYNGSLIAFQDVERVYPNFSKIPTVKLMQIYLTHLKREYEISIKESEAFLSLYPRSEHVPYIKYLKAMSNYRQITGLTKSYEVILATIAEMQHIVKTYPGTAYAKNASDYYDYLQIVLTNYSFSIGESYYEDRDYFAAINRYKRVIDREKTMMSKTFSPLAYFRIFECYFTLGMIDLAEFYKQRFLESMRNFDGSVSFNIEGVTEHIASTDKRRLKKNFKEKDTSVNMKNLDTLGQNKQNSGKTKVETKTSATPNITKNSAKTKISPKTLDEPTEKTSKVAKAKKKPKSLAKDSKKPAKKA